jgi:hypothetical protein
MIRREYDGELSGKEGYNAERRQQSKVRVDYL